MRSQSPNTATTHHSDAPVACKVKCVEIGAGRTPEFPITYVWDTCLEPESSPVQEMLAIQELEIGYCHSGSGILVAQDRVVPFTAGSISVVGERTMHMALSEKGKLSRWSYFWIDHRRLLTGMPDDLEILAQDPFNSPEYPYVFSPVKHKSLCQTVYAIVEELRGRSYGHRMIAKGLVCAFMASLYRTCRDMRPGRQASAQSGLVRVAPALHWMASHYAEHVDALELAKLCNLSLVHFRRIFLAALGRPPLHYLAQLRIRMSAAILAGTDKPISMVAYEVGFESINTFNRHFRAAMGATPREWRQHQRAN